MVLCMGVGRKKRRFFCPVVGVGVCVQGGVRMGKILPGGRCRFVQRGGSGWEKSCPVWVLVCGGGERGM